MTSLEKLYERILRDKGVIMTSLEKAIELYKNGTVLTMLADETSLHDEAAEYYRDACDEYKESIDFYTKHIDELEDRHKKDIYDIIDKCAEIAANIICDHCDMECSPNSECNIKTKEKIKNACGVLS